jgi:hypothetical protein
VDVKPGDAELEAEVAQLRAVAQHDRNALAPLSQRLWRLGRTREALEIYHELLRTELEPLDAEFDEIYLAALQATDTCPIPIRRRYRLKHAVEVLLATQGSPGDVVECGCFRGMSSYVLCSALQGAEPAFDGSAYHIFDSFEGLSEPTLDDEIPPGWHNEGGLRRMSVRGSFAAPLSQVRRNLRRFPNISYHPGWIPLTFRGLPDRQYRFVHVDVDLYDPTLDALRYFYPRLSAEGAIVSDDYLWPGARTAIEEFVHETGAALTISAFDQAIVRKPG